MLLLYRSHVSVAKRHNLFTFHYASTLSPATLELAIGQITHLHSTMLLLYLLLQSDISPVFHIYIPLCFYFIYRLQVTSILYSDIYIPLCFYFINSAVSWTISSMPNLHSTMLLLYLSWFHSTFVSSPDLHSTMLLLYPRPRPETGP